MTLLQHKQRHEIEDTVLGWDYRGQRMMFRQFGFSPKTGTPLEIVTAGIQAIMDVGERQRQEAVANGTVKMMGHVMTCPDCTREVDHEGDSEMRVSGCPHCTVDCETCGAGECSNDC